MFVQSEQISKTIALCKYCGEILTNSKAIYCKLCGAQAGRKKIFDANREIFTFNKKQGREIPATLKSWK